MNKVLLEIKIPVSYAGVQHFIRIYDFKVSIFVYVYTGRVTAIAQWLRRCATNRIRFQIVSLALGSTQHLKEISTSNTSGG